MPLVREPGTDARPILWQGWRAWRLRLRLPEVIGFRTISEEVHRDLPEADEHGPGVIHTVGRAAPASGITPFSSCYACASHPGRVRVQAANGEGWVWAPCPVPHPTVTED